MSGPGTFLDSSLPYELDQRVRRELGTDEQLLWVGQPNPRRAMWQTVPIVLFGIPWTAFSVFWVVMAGGIGFMGFGEARGNQDQGIPFPFGWFFVCFPLFGVPFVLIGLAMLTSPIWAARRAKNTCYAVTDRRAILWEAGWFGQVEVRSYQGPQLQTMRRVELADGSGDLIFEEQWIIGRNSRGHVTKTCRQHGFIGIPHVREIEDLLRKTLVPRPESERKEG